MAIESRPPLIVHVVYRFDYGGLENGIVNLVNNVPVDRYRHGIVCLAGYGEGFRSRITRPDVPVLSIEKQPGKDPAAYWRMWRLLKRLRPAVVHTRNLGTLDFQWAALAAGVRRRVHGEHGWSPSDPKGLDPRNLRLRRLCRPLVQRHVAMSQDIARWLELSVGVAPAEVRQIYNGVDLARFGPQGPRAADLPWNGKQMLTIGTVGRLDPIKNQIGLLHALHAIFDRRPDLRERTRLIIVGDGPMRAELRDARDALGLAAATWMPGARSDVPELMRALDVFVLPSHNEGISNTILEAMASSLPVVAARVGGNPELIVDGATGALYDERDPAGIADAVLRYLDHPGLRKAHGAAGAARVERHFSLRSMVDGYLDLYDELLNVRHHRHR